MPAHEHAPGFRLPGQPPFSCSIPRSPSSHLPPNSQQTWRQPLHAYFETQPQAGRARDSSFCPKPAATHPQHWGALYWCPLPQFFLTLYPVMTCRLAVCPPPGTPRRLLAPLSIRLQLPLLPIFARSAVGVAGRAPAAQFSRHPPASARLRLNVRLRPRPRIYSQSSPPPLCPARCCACVSFAPCRPMYSFPSCRRCTAAALLFVDPLTLPLLRVLALTSNTCN